MDGQRSKFLPDVPTTVELGYPTVIQSVSRGIVGPKGIPAAVLKKIQGVFINAMKAPGYIEKMEKVSLEIKPMVGDEYGKYIKCDHDQTKPLLDAARKLR
jgi:tripartite-type tricarboxylate transporter receptor subunit TctC